VHVCQKRGLHSLRLLPHFSALNAHRLELEAMPHATFAKPAHLPSLEESLELIEDDVTRRKSKVGPAWDDWQTKVRIGYERLVDSLWRAAKEFDVRGYGIVLREKLTTKWCDCGCSTDHLGEVCERTVREEEGSGVRSGKEREWDGRGIVLLFLTKRILNGHLSQKVAVYSGGKLMKRRIFGTWNWTSVG